VIPNGVDARFRPADADAILDLRRRMDLPARYVLCVGSLEPRKNLRRLLDAWRRLPQSLSDTGLVLAGAEHAVFRQAGLDELPPGVRLAGYVPDADLPTLYSGATAFVYPSLYEGFGLTILEAMACGTPVICSNATALPEVAGDAAITVDPLDAEAIAAAIERLVGDEALLARYRAMGLERAKQFSWDRTAAATADVLQAAANEDDAEGAL
jgi:glycosyltransferase involved in cell wall biosynthesis